MDPFRTNLDLRSGPSKATVVGSKRRAVLCCAVCGHKYVIVLCCAKLLAAVLC